ncbi:PREDICTED: von Willebrand factor [Papilio xuthus]|uniref:von Willebrand factor n=1 Tax=Papilio xuthus TaxID=66420 RepID=A0AAJ6ZUW9_PAPXU|nr:PREDICTED: von Willebrand factor [Papilio xuthus]
MRDTTTSQERLSKTDGRARARKISKTRLVYDFIFSEECPTNEEYLLCGSSCPYNCTNPPEKVVCAQECIEGCFCVAGYLRNETGNCVLAEECLKAGNTPMCEENEEFMSCGSACPATCSQPEPLECSLACSIGCFCKSGYYRDDVTNKCVTLDKCSIKPCTKENEVFDMCNAGCQPSCKDPDPVCTKVCSSGCVCSPGLLRSADKACD